MKKIPLILFVVLIALAQGSCSYLTYNGRHQAAYARYIRHSSYNRMKLQQKLSAFAENSAAKHGKRANNRDQHGTRIRYRER